MYVSGRTKERGKMRNLNGFKWICVLAISGTTANADLIIDNQSIAGTDIQSISVGPTTGHIYVTTKSGYSVTPSSTEPLPPDVVAITAFSASLSTLTEGQSTTLSWTTQNASTCTASGGTGGWNTLDTGLPNGSVNITIAAAGTYTFTLTCQDAAGGSAVKSTTVTVSVKPITQTCSAAPLSGTVVAWENFWLSNFPAPGYDNRFVTIPKTGYYALKFKTGNIVDDGKMSTVETTITDGVRLGSFSECPGDFDVAPECDYVWGISGGIRWATNGRTGACQLKPNTTYYFNVTFTDGVSGTTSTCNTNYCVTNLQHVNQ
jgi:hypothetical protein